MTDERLIDLETRLAFQEDAIGQLNDVIVEQRDQIDRLERAFRRLRERMLELQNEGAAPADEQSEVPPHY